MSTLTTLRRQAWIGMGTACKDEKKLVGAAAAVALLPVPTWTLLAMVSIPVWAQVVWFIFGILATIVGIVALCVLISEERRVRKIVKSAVDEHVADTLSERRTNLSLSERLKEKSQQYDTWGSLNPRQLRWIEHTYQNTMRKEVESRAESKRISNDHYGSFATIDRIGDSDSRAVREVKSFLKGLDELQAQDKVEITDPNKRELHEFDQQMNRALSA